MCGMGVSARVLNVEHMVTATESRPWGVRSHVSVWRRMWRSALFLGDTRSVIPQGDLQPVNTKCVHASRCLAPAQHWCTSGNENHLRRAISIGRWGLSARKLRPGIDAGSQLWWGTGTAAHNSSEEDKGADFLHLVGAPNRLRLAYWATCAGDDRRVNDYLRSISTVSTNATSAHCQLPPGQACSQRVRPSSRRAKHDVRAGALGAHHSERVRNRSTQKAIHHSAPSPPTAHHRSLGTASRWRAQRSAHIPAH